ncbi:3,4-dihydroxy-2-butanone-4-phosphate synthase [Rhodococcus sp. NPDC056960]|uniref:3,4-dihydroxy-2-butanone-4-phosphate synthase n=1 Tax=Rhodococcus sp. NPDC056960 TaxID=3345982 RepID=UPI00363DD004
MTLTLESGTPTLSVSECDSLRPLADGLPVVLCDAAAGQGFLVVAADRASTTATAFAIRHSSGFLQIALPRHVCEELLLPPMNPFEADGDRMCVGVDAVHGTGTGISAADRATTARALLDSAAEPGDFTRPGHLVPVCVDHAADAPPLTTAAIALDLVRRAGLRPGALLAELVGLADPTRMITRPECLVFAETHHLPLLTVQ